MSVSRSGRFGVFLLRRVAALIPQMLGISLVTFALIRLLPGNPAELILGPQITPEGVEALARDMGLDRPLHEQYLNYISHVVQGDLGRSWFTGQTVAEDLLSRTPATLELITYSLLVSLLVGVTLGTLAAFRSRSGGGIVASALTWYTRFAGSLPDFWLALVAVYVFFFQLRWVPPPLGRLGIHIDPPEGITGFYTIDALWSGDFTALGSAFAHLVLPVLVLGLIMSPAFAKVTRASVLETLDAEFLRYSEALGLSQVTRLRYAFRNASPPIVTFIGIRFVYLLGGAVLMEKVFAWGGVGQYAVQSVVNSDYAAIQGFVLVASVFTLLVYLFVDVIHMWLDPRVSHYHE